MKAVTIACVAFFVTIAYTDGLQCNSKKINIPREWIDMVDPCVKAVRKQIQEELNASMQYMAMGAYFSRDIVNRPGFAKLFFDSASEEREHSIKLISYLLTRGELTKDVSTLIKRINAPDTIEWTSGVDALRSALTLEAKVTKMIRDVIKVCEAPGDSVGNYNDYELVDYLTGEFLTEQYHGQREIAGRISTLDKMMDKHGALGEFLYDKSLLG